MSINNYAEKFSEVKPKYEKLGMNVKQALESLLQDNNIPYLSINYRVKEQKSFLEKIERKKYENPLIQTEDICGVRIICYFQNDIEKIQKIIETEFNVTQNEIKEEKLNSTEFGYRSTHLIAQVKNEWAKTPAFKGIDNLKFEIQVRTILMHSWAEIEHKLAYKSESDIPKELRRKFSFISAILEAADTQFEEIKVRIDDNKKKLITDAEQNQRFDDSVELNLDNLQAFLDYAFKGRKRDIKQTQRILNEMLYNEISFPDLVKGFIKYENVLPKMEEKDVQNLTPDDKEYFLGDANSDSKILWAQSGAVRNLMMLISEKYRNYYALHERVKFIEKYLIKD